MESFGLALLLPVLSRQPLLRHRRLEVCHIRWVQLDPEHPITGGARQGLAGPEGHVELCRAGAPPIRFEPAARIGHLNLDRLSAALHEQFLAGVLIGEQRAARWPWWRRLVYIFGAGLIPFVLVRRVWPGIRRIARTERLPIMTLPSIVLLMFAKATGELVGYAGKGTAKHAAALEHYEIHKVEYLASKPG